MKKCKDCGLMHEQDQCPRCVGGDTTSEASSVDQLDQLVSQASVPNLADLFRKAKQTGVIGSVTVYGEGA